MTKKELLTVVLFAAAAGISPAKGTAVDDAGCPPRKSSAAGGVADTNRLGNEECVVWHDYDGETAKDESALLQTQNAIRTERSVACRVLQKSVDDPSKDDYYEFGTMDLSTAPSLCVLHRDPSSSRHHRREDFQIAFKNESACDHFWAPMSYDVDPLGPNIVRLAGVEARELDSPSPDIAICRYREEDDGDGPRNERGGREAVIGRMVMEGKLFGHCGYLTTNSNGNNDTDEVFVGGNFEAFSAIPRVEVREIDDAQRDDDNKALQWNDLVTDIRKRVSLYLTKEDEGLIASISGHSVEELVEDLNNTDVVGGYDVLARVLSTDRFIPHDILNTKGLSLLRAVVAERMTSARRRRLGLNRHPDAPTWERDGVLLKDFDYYTDERNSEEFDELLQMVAASNSVSAGGFRWLERNVTASDYDPQREPHIDTFHSVVKMWVYERGVVTNETGPLYFMRGSNRNTRGKLTWIYNASLPPATEAIKEPSLRFRGDVAESPLESGMPDVLRPVLPRDDFRRTLIIADTSGIHHRGNAVPGTVRRTIRVSNGNDGGLPRQNPYFWDDWETPAAAVHGEEAACAEPGQQ